MSVKGDNGTYKKTMDWSSALLPNLVQALRARSSASPMALPSFSPFGPRVEEVYVLRQIRACDESLAVGKETWKRLARWAVKWVSDCR